MSETDSFIDEVTDELRKDRMAQLLRRWAWLGVLLVLLIVGGAAYNEWRKASAKADAELFGDQLLAGVAAGGGDAFSEVTADTPEKQALLGLMQSAGAISEDNREAAVQALETIRSNADAPAIYRDIASFKAALAMPSDGPIEDRTAAFEALAAPGAPFALLAQEQLALIKAEAGDKEGAIAQLSEILQAAELTQGLQRRASELIVALGGTLPEFGALSEN